MAEENGVYCCYGVMMETDYIIPLTGAVILLRDIFHNEMIKSNDNKGLGASGNACSHTDYMLACACLHAPHAVQTIN